ncbi:hypothetical protein G7Y79_00001g002270 [Physcia stellaris]|nr:hypothetical protein G7Y79_00001g002270 [Physcia stellaris]
MPPYNQTTIQNLLNGDEAIPDDSNQPATAPVQQQDDRKKIQSLESESQAQSPLPLPSATLPLSPLMDPKLTAARERHRTPKPAPSERELSAFSKKLRSNPFAQALATPVRQCRFTGLRLPEYFHLDFGLQSHPTTGKPWHLPKLALTAESKAASEDTGAEEDAGLDEKSTLRFISRLEKEKYRKLFPLRWKTGSNLETREVVWRQDMDTYVLGLLRKDLLTNLKYIASRPVGYMVGCGAYEQIGKHAQVGAALWLGDAAAEGPSSTGFEGTGSGGDTGAASEGSDGPPPAYAMLDYRGRYIPLYNLRTLLGLEYLEQLKGLNAIFQNKFVVVKQKRNTVKIQLALWKLMGYLAANE